jgi:sugar phosphate isomerase/epimerase
LIQEQQSKETKKMNFSRRNFLYSLGATSSLAMLGGCRALMPARAKPEIAAQLYSIHKIFWNKPEWCLAGLKVAGFDGVEFAGYGGRSAAEIRKMLAVAGMKAMGSHVNGNVDLVGDGLKRTLDFCAEAGIASVTTPHASRKTADEYRRFGHEMGLAAEAAEAYGIKVGIHTAAHHFKSVYDGVRSWELMFSEASPLLQQQIDTGNSFNAGADVMELLRNGTGRHFSIHLKENTPSKTAILGERPSNGAPCVPWNDVMAYIAGDDVSWLVIEAEAIPTSLEPLTASIKFLGQYGFMKN